VRHDTPTVGDLPVIVLCFIGPPAVSTARVVIVRLGEAVFDTAIKLELEVDPGGAHLLDEAVDLGQRRGRVVGAMHDEDAAFDVLGIVRCGRCQRAVKNGLNEVQVYRFPNFLCTDRGRAINQMETGWENTLTGIPKEIYQLWKDYLQPRGYKIAYQIIDFPGGVPGDIGVTLSWK